MKQNASQWWNSNKCLWACKKHHIYEKDYVGILLHVIVKNGKYLANIMEGSGIICDEVTEWYDEEITIPTNFNEKGITCKAQNLYCLLVFLLITIALP